MSILKICNVINTTVFYANDNNLRTCTFRVCLRLCSSWL